VPDSHPITCADICNGEGSVGQSAVVDGHKLLLESYPILKKVSIRNWSLTC